MDGANDKAGRRTPSLGREMENSEMMQAEKFKYAAQGFQEATGRHSVPEKMGNPNERKIEDGNVAERKGRNTNYQNFTLEQNEGTRS